MWFQAKGAVIIMILEITEVGADVSSPLDGMGEGCSGVVLDMSVSCLEEVPDGAYGPL